MGEKTPKLLRRSSARQQCLFPGMEAFRTGHMDTWKLRRAARPSARVSVYRRAVAASRTQGDPTETLLRPGSQFISCLARAGTLPVALRSVAAADRRASLMPAPITGSTTLNTFQKRSLRRKLQRFSLLIGEIMDMRRFQWLELLGLQRLPQAATNSRL